MEYSDFECLMPSEYPGDWGGAVIECSDCNKNIEIDEVEWI